MQVRFILLYNEVKLSILAVIIGMNLYAFLLFNLDKRRAVRGSYRISEKQLLTSAFLFGGIGAWLGMVIFKHKTRHLLFRLSLPLAMLLTSFTVYGIVIL
ncbi:membrane protein [Alkalibacterium kapii]|uniref:Membrane protein n=2 Tax=Alkalibacterium kapii TaxID=426704 RepID=A0A511AU69_9LACT|nr:membrane protein [Alkalibacterium kapii]